MVLCGRRRSVLTDGSQFTHVSRWARIQVHSGDFRIVAGNASSDLSSGVSGLTRRHDSRLQADRAVHAAA